MPSRQNKDALIGELGEAFRRAQNVNQLFDRAAAERLGVNLTDLFAMDLLHQRGQLTAGELAREMGLTTGAVTAVVDRLQRAGYAERVRDEHDRRRVSIRLTDKALDAVNEIYEPMKLEWVRYMNRWSTAELELMLGFMRGAQDVVLGHLDRVRGGPDERSR